MSFRHTDQQPKFSLILYVALDLKYIGREEFNELFTLFDEISKMTMSLSVYLRKSQPVTKTP